MTNGPILFPCRPRHLLFIALIAFGGAAGLGCTNESPTGTPPPPPPPPPSAVKLAFTVQPGTTEGMQAIAPAVQVTIENAAGARVSGATNAVTLAIGTNPVGGTLSGAVTENAVDGIATFAGLTMDRPGGGYTLSATASSLTGTTSTAFDIHVTLVTLSSGYTQTCGVTVTAATYCWGYNGTGEVSDTGTNRTPVPVAGAFTFAAVSAGVYHSCGLTTAGAAYCWGYNGDGGLGTGTTTSSSRTTPVAVFGGLKFSAIHGGYTHTCGVTAAAAAYCWGVNINGQLGTGTTSDNSTSPVAVSGALTFASVSAGPFHTCGVTTAGAAYCWGDNTYGQLGTGDTASSTTPVAVSGGLTFATVSAGGGFTCGLTTAGAAYCWGANGAGNLGTGGTARSTIPVAVSGGLTFTAVSAGGGFNCGLTTAGAAYCWGYNIDGELGNGTITGSTMPVAVSGGLTFSALSAGLYHTCGLTTAGAAYCWGYGQDGSLGNGTQTTSFAPVRVVQ